MTRIRNTAMDDLVACEPSDTSPGYEMRDNWGTTYVSREGVEMFAQSARILEACRPYLEGWLEHFADVRCEHGVRFDDDSWEWWVNDSVFDLKHEPERAVLILVGGFHGDDYCVPVYFERALGCFTWHPWLKEPPA